MYRLRRLQHGTLIIYFYIVVVKEHGSHINKQQFFKLNHKYIKCNVFQSNKYVTVYDSYNELNIMLPIHYNFNTNVYCYHLKNII